MDRDVLSATGDNDGNIWCFYRRPDVETMSQQHRAIEKYNDITPESMEWTSAKAESSKWKVPAEVTEKITALPRRAPYPTLKEIPVNTLMDVADMEPAEGGGPGFVLTLAKGSQLSVVQHDSEENLFLESLRMKGSAVYRENYQGRRMRQNGTV